MLPYLNPLRTKCNLRPDILPKASIKVSEILKDFSDPSIKTSVVSSPYWLSLNSVSCILIPLISLLFRMASVNISTESVKR